MHSCSNQSITGLLFNDFISQYSVTKPEFNLVNVSAVNVSHISYCDYSSAYLDNEENQFSTFVGNAAFLRNTEISWTERFEVLYSDNSIAFFEINNRAPGYLFVHERMACYYTSESSIINSERFNNDDWCVYDCGKYASDCEMLGFPPNCCETTGITCDSSGHITRLRALQAGLALSSVPRLLLLKHLVELDLSRLNLELGHVPSICTETLSTLRRLDISHNNISGNLSFVNGMNRLKVLDASHNMLTGFDGVKGLKELREFRIAGNDIDLPATINDLKLTRKRIGLYVMRN